MKATFRPPDYKYLVFVQSNRDRQIYDLINTSSFNKFVFFRLSEPKADYLIKQGAKYVIESWKGAKILHTGLIPIYENYFMGDHKDTTDKTSLMITKIEPDKIQIWYLNHYNKKSNKMKRDFCREFIKKMVGGNHTPDLMFNPDNCQS